MSSRYSYIASYSYSIGEQLRFYLAQHQVDLYSCDLLLWEAYSSNCMPPASLISCKLFVTSGAAIDNGPRYIPCQYAHVRHFALPPPVLRSFFAEARAIPNVAQNLLRCCSVVGTTLLRRRRDVAPLSARHRIPYVACRFEVAPLSLRHRSVVAALSLHYRRAIECLLRLPV